MSSLQHLSDQERMITSRLLPADDPVEAVFKPPESLPHSYFPAPPPRAASALAAPVSLRVPRALQQVGREATNGPPTEELSEDPAAAALGNTESQSVSYQKVRRWDMLPKHAWLQAAESGQAPGPGFRDVSASQTMRSYGPKGALPPLAGAPSAVDTLPDLSAGGAKASPSSRIAANYSPKAVGLTPSTLHMGVPEHSGNDEEAEAEVEVGEDEGASTFLPLEFFDGGEMEPLPDSLWEDAEAMFEQGKPYLARSKFYSVGGKDALLPCEVRGQ
jgi:hypothetical protein